MEKLPNINEKTDYSDSESLYPKIHVDIEEFKKGNEFYGKFDEKMENQEESYFVSEEKMEQIIENNTIELLDSNPLIRLMYEVDEKVYRNIRLLSNDESYSYCEKNGKFYVSFSQYMKIYSMIEEFIENLPNHYKIKGCCHKPSIDSILKYPMVFESDKRTKIGKVCNNENIVGYYSQTFYTYKGMNSFARNGNLRYYCVVLVKSVLGKISLDYDTFQKWN